ncbi:MAG TPA: flagellar basal body rod C-terminal domain-containing protein [Caldimonas sp.]|nr:flagellar basal body rod C-terminal domain-containing protein [Caldimonas sp.]
MTEFDILGGAAAGMAAERDALDVFARNVAAAQAAPEGGTFERLVPQFAAPSSDALDDDDGAVVRFTGTRSERASGGDAVTEMVAMLDAQRAYEADASIFDLGKRLAERTIDLERMP